MTEITLPDLSFWWTWIPVYIFIAGIIFSFYFGAILKDKDTSILLWALTIVLTVFSVPFVLAPYEQIKDDAIESAVVESTGLENFTRNGDNFFGEGPDGEYVSGFIVERDGVYGYVLD